MFILGGFAGWFWKAIDGNIINQLCLVTYPLKNSAHTHLHAYPLLTRSKCRTPRSSGTTPISASWMWLVLRNLFFFFFTISWRRWWCSFNIMKNIRMSYWSISIYLKSLEMSRSSIHCFGLEGTFEELVRSPCRGQEHLSLDQVSQNALITLT